MAQKIRSLFLYNTFLTIGFCGAFLFFIISLGVFVFVLDAPPHVSATSNTVSTAQSPVEEMHIANNGLVFLRGARIEHISSGELAVSLVWDSTTFHWNILLPQNAQFFKADGTSISLSDLKKGEVIMINGSIDTSASAWTIDAQTIHLIS